LFEEKDRQQKNMKKGKMCKVEDAEKCGKKENMNKIV
jgi:hypothetical protein